MSYEENIKTCRKKAGLTQKEVAAQLGIGVRQYIRIEQGAADAKISQVMQLAQIFGVTIGHLLGGSDGEQTFHNTLPDPLQPFNEWAVSLIKKDQRYKDWLTIELKRHFPDYSKWLGNNDPES